jgi:hypothetical protein
MMERGEGDRIVPRRQEHKVWLYLCIPTLSVRTDGPGIRASDRRYLTASACAVSSVPNQIAVSIIPLISHEVPVPPLAVHVLPLAVPDDDEWYRCVSPIFTPFLSIRFCNIYLLSMYNINIMFNH